MASESSPSGRDTAPAHGAGAYGFSRIELRGLIVLSVLAGGLIIYEWFHRRPEQSVPAWVIEDVVIGSAQSPLRAGVTESVTNNPTALPPDNRQSGEVTDLGHVLVNINTADQRELIRLPGIGPALAGRIIADREKKGPFTDLRDLERVRGIGPKMAAVLAGRVRFSRARALTIDTSGVP